MTNLRIKDECVNGKDEVFGVLCKVYCPTTNKQVVK